MPRPSEPEGADMALRRFLYNWHNRTTDPVAADDFWHGVANLAVELVRDMSVPKPKLVGKAALVALVVGAVTMLIAAVGFLAMFMLWAL